MSTDYIKPYMNSPTPFANESNFQLFVGKNVIVFGSVSSVKNHTLFLNTGASGKIIINYYLTAN